MRKRQASSKSIDWRDFREPLVLAGDPPIHYGWTIDWEAYHAECDKGEDDTMKPILCVDFDGVIHSYTSGWKGADVISDPPVPGALPFLVKATEHFRVAIFSSRSCQPGGIKAMREWLGFWSVDEEHGMPNNFDHGTWGLIEWPTEKPSAFLTIDDRAITFNGTWPSMEDILNFKPWNKK